MLLKQAGAMSVLTGQVPLTCCALGAGEGIGDSLKSLLALLSYNLMIHWISTRSFITSGRILEILLASLCSLSPAPSLRLLLFQTLGYALWFSPIKGEASPANQEL